MNRIHCVLATAMFLLGGQALAGERIVERMVKDNSYWDFRFALGGEPRMSEAHYEPYGAPPADAAWDASGGSFEFNAAHRFRARGPHSTYFTAGAFLRGFNGDTDPPTATNIHLGIVGIQGGYGYSYWDGGPWALELGPELSLGAAHSEEEYPPYGDAIEGDGGYAKFAVQVRNIWTFTRFQIGFTLGGAGWAASTTYDPQYLDTGGGPTFFAGGDADYKGHGLFGNLFMGWR